MNISLFTDWIEEGLFGESELAHLIADIVDEAMARETPGQTAPAERVDAGLLRSAWEAAEKEDELVRARTAIVLGRLGFAPAGPALESARTCEERSVARAAAIVLARLRGLNDELRDALVATLEDPAEAREIRSAAGRALAQSGSPPTAMKLVDTALSADPDLAQYGIEALGSAKLPPGSPESDAARGALLDALKKKDPALKMAAAEALGNFGDPAAVRDLEAVLIEKDAALRRRALFALARLGADSARAPLSRMLRDFSIPARWEIVDLLARAYGESMVDALALAAQDRDAEMRDHVVSALARLDGPASYQLLQKIARDDADSFVREQAAQGLARRDAEAPVAAPAPPPEPVARPAEEIAVERAAPPAPAAPFRPEPVEEQAPPPVAPETPRVVRAPARPAPRAPVRAPVPAAPTAATAGVPKAAPKLRPLFAQAAAPPPPESKEPTNVIERALESLECTWWIDAQGYQVQVPLANGKEKVSVLLGRLDYEDSPVYRFVVSCGPADPAAYGPALRNNLELDYGSLALSDEGDRPVFVLTDTMLASAATVASVRKALTSLARSAAQLRGE